MIYLGYLCLVAQVGLIVALICLARNMLKVQKEIEKIEKEVGDYLQEVVTSEDERENSDRQVSQGMLLTSVLEEIFP